MHLKEKQKTPEPAKNFLDHVRALRKAIASALDLPRGYKLWREEFPYDPYHFERKREAVSPLFDSIDLGNTVLDIGSGIRGIRALAKEKIEREKNPDLRIISLDYAGVPSGLVEGRDMHLEFDLNNILVDTPTTITSLGAQHAVSLQEFLQLHVAKFLGVDPRTSSIEQVDTIYCSDILNYFDYRTLLSTAVKYLKPGGKLIIFNKPNRGFIGEFSELRPDSNSAVRSFLSDQLGFHLEQPIYPPMADDFENIERDPEQDHLFQVAIKPH